jgi:anti-sigma factor RsiW
MLAYLEDLCGALIAHDADAIQRLLAHPLARSLPRAVREEAIAISRANAASLRAPIQTLRFYHQTLQLGAPNHHMQPDEPGADDPTDAAAHEAPGPVAMPVEPPVRESHRYHATLRDQIELPLDAPRKAQAA